jgi:ABC-type phosphate transport system substrate-binding protein
MAVRLALPRTASALALAFAVAMLALGLVTRSTTAFGDQRDSAPAFQVIVNPGNDLTRLDRSFVEDAFLKKITTWPDGEIIKPVDLVPDSPVRRAFSHEVLNRSVEAVKGYWQQRIFSGRDVPPPELGSDEEIVDFVLKHAGGIGYVSATAKLNGCKVVVVR